jgi:hypothetical protein
MTIAGDTRVQFSELEQPELAEYSPLNRCALISFVLGWLSGLALLHPILGIVPLVGTILAIVALQQLRSTDTKQSGRTLAVIGLGLAVLFGTWAIARQSSRDLRLFSQARLCAEEWLELLRQGKLEDAHQLTLPEESRAPAGLALKAHYAADDHDHKAHEKAGTPAMHEMMEMMMHPHVELDGFFSEAVAKRLREMGPRARYEFLGNVQVMSAGVNDIELELLFQVNDASASDSDPFPIKVTLVRSRKPGDTADWRVTKVSDPNRP